MRSAFRTFLPLALGALVVAGCPNKRDDPNSTITLAITDAPSDELASFVVEIESVQLSLHHRDHVDTVGALPARVEVDLVTLGEVSQVLNVMIVSAGKYTRADVTLDFTDARVYLLGETTPASIVDGDGVPVTGRVELPIDLGAGFDAFPDRHHLLELDFDLSQSVEVDAATNTVVLEPALVLRVDRGDPKALLLGGELAGVAPARSRFTLDVQTPGGLPICTVEVEVGGDTIYQVDGVPAQGAGGLAALDALAPGTWVQLYGVNDLHAREIDAFYVEAGAGTFNGGQGIVDGHVVGRAGSQAAPQFLVLGHGSDASHTQFQFNTLFTVNATFADTKVLLRGALQTLDTDDVNVGQRVRIFGALTDTFLDATSPTSVVRMEPARVLGFAAAPPGAAGTLTVDVERVDLRPETAFTWSEGGITPPDPDALLVQVGDLGDGLDIVAGTPVEVIGFFTAVGAPFAQDFVAFVLVNRALAPTLLAIHDRADGMRVTPAVSADEIRFSLSGTAGPAELAVLDEGFVGQKPLPAAPEPRVVPNAQGIGLFVIRDRKLGSCALFLDFADFAAALDGLLGRGAQLYNFGAIGPYTSATNSLESGLVFVVVN